MIKKVKKVIEGYEVTCLKCGYKWFYTGKSDNRITCSKCKYEMFLKRM